MNRALLEAPFPPEMIRQREGKTGVLLDYVEAHAVIQRLNEALAGKWSFEVLEHRILPEANEVLVLGRLKADGVVKTQFGSSRLTRHRHSGEPTGLGDDLKAAATDCLKKCASLLGVGLYLYGGSLPEPAPEPAPAPPPTAVAPGGRPTARQLQLIRRLAAEQGLNAAELSRHCQAQFGHAVEALSKGDASALIDALMADRPIRPAEAGGGAAARGGAS